jgi:hypothetical protein
MRLLSRKKTFSCGAPDCSTHCRSRRSSALSVSKLVKKLGKPEQLREAGPTG